MPDRCEGIEFDAITPDENGVTFFFKGVSLNDDDCYSLITSFKSDFLNASLLNVFSVL